MAELDLRRQNWVRTAIESREVVKVETPNSPRYQYQYEPLKPIYHVVSSNVLLIGLTSRSAKPWWYLGARVSRYLYISPSLNNELPQGVQSSESKKVGLNRLTLIEFKNYELDAYVLSIEPPYWLEDVYVEIWEYAGIKNTLEDAFAQLILVLGSMEQNLNGVVARLERIENIIDRG